MPSILTDCIYKNDANQFEELYRQGVRLKDELSEDELKGRTELHMAVSDYATNIIRNIVAHFPELISIPDSYQRTPLHNAFFCGDQETVEILLKAGATVTADTPDLFLKIMAGDLSFFPEPYELARNASKIVSGYNKIRDSSGASLLHFLAASPVFKFLVICEYFPLEADDFGWTPLHVAVCARRKLTASAIISDRKIGADILNSLDAYGFGLLHYVARYNQDVLETLANLPNVDVNVRSNLGRTPLHEAAIADAAEAIFILHHAGAMMDVLDDSGCTPLMSAVLIYSQKAASALFKSGAKNLPCGKYGYTPFKEARRFVFDTSGAVIKAIKNSHYFLLAALLDDESSPFPQANFDETQCDENCYPPFLYALDVGNLECINLLFSRVKNLSIQSTCGRGAFQVIAERRNETDYYNFKFQLCLRCADAGLNVDDSSKSAPSALTSAVRQHDFALAAFLIALGADVNLETSPPLESVESVEMLVMLVGLGANMNSQAAINLACDLAKAGNVEMVDYLIHRWPHLLNALGWRGRTPLEEGLRRNKNNIGPLLLSLNEKFACNDKPI